LPAIPENNQNDGCRATPTRPNIAPELGTTVANGIPFTEMHGDQHFQHYMAIPLRKLMERPKPQSPWIYQKEFKGL
jgi:hypothetical protein